MKNLLRGTILFILLVNLSTTQVVLADEPISSPEPSATPTSQPTETPQPIESPQPSPEPSIIPAPSESPTSSPQPSATPTPAPSESPAPVPSTAPESTPSGTLIPTSTPEPISTPSPTPETTPSPTSSPNPSPSPTPPAPNISQIVVGTIYSSPSGNTKVKFNSISDTTGSLDISESSLSSSQVTQLGALSSIVYNISSSMANDTFTYDLTLPYPIGVTGTNFKVLYASDINGLTNGTKITQSITDNGDNTFTIHNLNHFTVFVVVNPDSQANCDTVTLGTTPGSTCYTTVQAAVNVSSDGDTINVGSTGSPYNETVYVNKQLTFVGSGNPTVTAFVLQTTPVTITGITTSVSIATPTVALTNPVNSSNQTTVSITGTGTANSTVNWTITGTSGSVPGIGTVSSGGVINVPNINVSSLPDGPLTLTVYLTSGTYSSTSATAAAFKDTTAPVQASSLTITNPINIGNQTSISFSGNGEAGTTVSWTLSNGASSSTGTTTVSGAGTFSVSGRDISGFPDGTITLVVTLSDSAGNTSSSSSQTATKDTVTPSLTTVTIGSNNANSSYAKVGNVVTLNFTSSEAISTPTVSIAGHSVVATNTGGNNWTASYTMTSSDTEGLVPFTINFSDTAGNPGTQVTATTNSSSVTFDRTAPTLTSTSVTSSNANGLFTKVGDTITLTFTSSETIQAPSVTIATHTVTASNTSGNTWKAIYVMTSSDTEGLIAYTISYQDIASNVGVTVNTNSIITFDRTNPTLTASSVTSSNANSSYAKVGDTITVTFTSSEAILTPTVTIAGHAAIASNTSGNTWRVTYVMTSSDTEGLIAYTINYSDLASNSGTAVNTNSSITFDKTAPTLTATSVTSSNANGSFAKVGDTITVTLTASEAIQTPTITIAGHALPATNTSGNIWTATYVMTGGDSEGLIAYTIAFQDLASNSGATINTNSTITFDRTAPTLTSTTVTSSNANGSFAKVGDTISVTFTSSETIQTPTVTIAGNTITSTNPSGNTWVATYVMTSSDTEGLIAYTINYSDLASNAGTIVNTNSSITFDRTNPTLTSTSVTSSNANGSYAKVGDVITLTFTASEALQTPIVTIAGNNVIPTNTSGNTWVATYTMTSSDTEGLIAYTIAFQDLASNSGATINTNSTITFDKTAPTLTSTLVTSSNANGSYAKVGDTITVTLTADEAIQTPVVNIAGNAVTANNTTGNTWVATYVMTATDTEGLIAYTIDFQDLASNAGTSVNTNSSITFDMTVPTITSLSITSSNANSSYAKVGDTITVTFTTSETIQTPTIAIAGNTVTATNTSGNTWRATYVMTSSDTEGLIPYTIAFQDLASNSGTTVNTNSSITFDMSAPTIASSALITSNTDPSYAKVGDVVTLDFTSSETIQTPTVTIAGNSVTVTNIGGNNWRASYTLFITDTEGLIPYTIDYTDLAGNNGTSVNTNSTVTFDMTVPAITATVVTSSNTNGSFGKVGDTITVAFTTNEAIQTPTVTIAGHTVIVTNTGGNNWRAIYVMTSSDTEGLVAYTIDFSDLAGNPGVSVNASSGITFDRTPPTLTSTTVTSSNANGSYAKVGDTIAVTFTVNEAIQTPQVTIAGHPVIVTNTSGNSWVATYVMISGDVEGLIAYTISYQDLASNAGITINTNSTITFDGTSPTITSSALTTSNINPNLAQVGDTITLTFTSSETIQTPVVIIAGHGVTATNTSGNTWTATYTMVFGDTQGLIPYTISYQDLASNAATLNTNSTIFFDSTTPSLSATVASSSNTNPSFAKVGDTITVTFTSSEAILTPTVTIAGHAAIASNTSGNTWRVTYVMTSSDTEGLIAYTISFQDLASNPGTTVNTNSAITFDRTNPTLTSTSVTSSNANGSYAKVGDTITITFTASEVLQTPTVTIAGQVATNATYTLISTDPEGLINYTIAFQDLASNPGATVNVASSITFDRTNPTAAWTAPAANSALSGIVTLSGTSSDTNGIVSGVFSYKRNDGVDTFHPLPGNTWDTAGLALGSYTIRMVITDTAGNSTTLDQLVDVVTVISSASVTSTAITKESASITWTTADPASSRAIYDTVSHPVLGAAPNYGYANSTTIFDTSPKVTNHSVALSPLKASTTYYYRVVSAGSPEAVSTEFSFTTSAAAQAAQGGGAAGSSAPGAPSCNDARPGSAPALLSAKVNGNKVILTWSKAKDPVTYYLIKYGLGHDSYQFGMPNVGNVTEYEIGELTSGVTYYFRLRAGNGCSAGEFSNEFSATASGFGVSSLLGVKEVLAAEENQEASASASPFNKSNGIDWKKILLTAGVILLIAGGATYYRSLQKKNKI